MAQPWELGDSPAGGGFGADPPLGGSPIDPRQAQSLSDAIVAGLQNSATALALRGKMPGWAVGPDAPWHHRIGAGAAGMVADLPLSVVAAVGGATAGAAVGTAVPVVGTAAGAVVGGGAAAFAAPMALRDALIEAYSGNHAASWEGVWEIAKAALKGGGKGAVIGGATAGAGRFVAPLVAPAAGRMVEAGTLTAGGARALTGSTALGVELTTLTATSAALEGHMPTAQDFIDNAILLGGMKAAITTAQALRNIYAETGKLPVEVVAEAQRDAVLRDQLLHGTKAMPKDFWVRVDKTDKALAGELQQAITDFVGHGPDALQQATGIGGIMSTARLDAILADPAKHAKLSAAFEPVRAELRATFGDFVPLYRHEIVGPGAKERAALSWSFSRSVAEAFAGIAGARKPYSLEQLAKDVEVFERTGEVTVGFYRYAKAEDGGVSLLTRDGDYITGFENIRQALEQHRELTAETVARNEAKAVNIQQKMVPVDEIVWVTNRAGQQEAIVRNTARVRNAETITANRAGYEVPESFKQLALEERIKASIDADPRPEMIRSLLAGEKEPPKLGEAPLADPVRYEYITDRETLQGVLRAVDQLYRREMERQTRGVVPNKATAAEGLAMVADGKVVEHAIGVAENAAQIYARAHILRGVTRDAYTALQEIKGIPEGELTPMMKVKALAAIEKVSMAKAELEGVGAEAGRALQILGAIKRNPQLLGEAEGLIKLYERKGSLSDIAKIVDSMKDSSQLAEFAQRYTRATTGEKVIEAWKASILSGPQTHLANMMGNMTKWFVEIPESVIAASFTAISRAAKGEPLTMAQFKARAFSPLIGVQLGAREALLTAGEVLRGHGERLEKADVYRTAIEGTTGKVVRIPFRLLQAEDALFRTTAERAKAYELAVDRVTREGLDPHSREFRNTVMKYTNEPALGLGEKAAQVATEAIQTAGAEAVFTQRLGPRMEILQRAMQGHVGAQLIVPFVRTPTNLVSWAIQHTPGLNLLSARWRADFMAGGEARSKALARVVVGAGLAFTAYELVKEGMLTGGGMFDPEQRRTKMAAGWQPYSLKIGGKYYSYQRIEPVAKVLGIVADAMEMADKLEEDDRAKVASLAVLMFGNMTISTTYLSGLSNAMNALIDPTRYGENFLEQYASSLVPKVIGQTAAAMDPFKREVDGIADAIQSQIPIFRERLLPKRDVWGEPSQNQKWFSVLPVQVTQEATDKVRTEAVRLQVAIADAPRFLTERGPLKPGEKRIDLTQEQRDIFREVAGKNAMALLAPIVNAPDWNRIPDFAKAEIYKRVLEGTRKQGQYAALPPDDAARAKVREKIVNEIIKQTQQAESPAK